MQAHPYFTGVDWDTLTASTAPYIPEVGIKSTEHWMEAKKLEILKIVCNNTYFRYIESNFMLSISQIHTCFIDPA